MSLQCCGSMSKDGAERNAQENTLPKILFCLNGNIFATALLDWRAVIKSIHLYYQNYALLLL